MWTRRRSKSGERAGAEMGRGRRIKLWEIMKD
jgi:hypothetical protein